MTMKKLITFCIYLAIAIVLVCILSCSGKGLRTMDGVNSDKLDSINIKLDRLLELKEIETHTNQGRTRGYDFKRGGYIPYPTDEQVRELRRNNPEYIVKVPGRQIKNQRQLTEQQIEDYVEEHHDELLDRYRD